MLKLCGKNPFDCSLISNVFENFDSGIGRKLRLSMILTPLYFNDKILVPLSIISGFEKNETNDSIIYFNKKIASKRPAL